MTDLEGYAAALRESWESVRDVLIACSLFVEKAARAGDIEAQLLAEDLASARVWMSLETGFAKLALDDFERNTKNVSEVD